MDYVRAGIARAQQSHAGLVSKVTKVSTTVSQAVASTQKGAYARVKKAEDGEKEEDGMFTIEDDEVAATDLSMCASLDTSIPHAHTSLAPRSR